MSYTYDFPMFSLTTDIVVFIEREFKSPQVALIIRGQEPFKGSYALPGGYVEINERIRCAAVRELQEETGLTLSTSDLYYVGTYDDPNRDKRGRVVSTCFYALVGHTQLHNFKPGDDATHLVFENVNDILHGDVPLAFDHLDMIQKAYYKYTMRFNL